MFTANFNRFCTESSLDPKKVRGTLVLCQLRQEGSESVVKALGGVGTIVESILSPNHAQIFTAPGTMVDGIVGHDIEEYINSTR